MIGTWDNSNQDSLKKNWPLYLSAVLAAFCGIAYELLLASYATFLLGASIFQYSFVISLMMASMGLGSLVSDRFERSALKALLVIEIVLAVLAALALPILYFKFSKDFFPYPVLILFVVLIGGGLGMEIPLLNHISNRAEGLPRILFFDYFGGFVGGLLFPILLVPELGFFRIAALLSFCNAFTGLVLLVGYWDEVKALGWRVSSFLAVLLSAADMALAESIRIYMESGLFGIRY